MNLTTLQVDTLFLSNTVVAQYPLATIKNNINRYYDELVAFVWTCDNSWIFDEGVDYLPTATTDLVANQSDYQIPSTARQVFRVSILDSNGEKIKLKPISDKEVPEYEETGSPTSYRLVGRSVVLYPTPTYSKDQGVIIEMSKSVTLLDESTDEPKVEREFHRYLSYGATKDWYFSKSNINKKREMDREMESMKQLIKNFYNNRHKDYSPAKIKRVIENYS